MSRDNYEVISEKIKEASRKIVLEWLNVIKKNYQIEEHDVFPTDDLLDGVPTMIDGIAKVVQDSTNISQFDPGGSVYIKAQELGELRESQGFKVDQVINEYIFLKEILLNFTGKIAKKYKVDLFDFTEKISTPLDRILIITIETFVDRYSQTLQYLAITDDLTKIRNHRFFIEQLKLEIKRTIRYKIPLTLLMIDLDNFKKYNDAKGHLMGDEILRRFASILEENCRSADVVARYGGDEFGIILPNADSEKALKIGKRIVKAIKAESVVAKTNEGVFPVTVSIGLAQHEEGIKDPDELIRRSDEALYKAKGMSKNDIVIYKEDV